MKNKIIFLEGLPGSGKTTYAKRLHEYLVHQGINAEIYNEGDLHPIDLAWLSITSKQEYNKLLDKYSKYTDQIKKYTKIVNNKYITAYTKVRVDDSDISFYDDHSKHEIYRANDLSHFKNEHLTLWNSLKDTGSIYVFECVFLQNHINELILKFNLPKEEIITYMNDLISTIKSFDPLVIYLKPVNIKESIEHVVEERRSDNPNYKDWIQLVIDYFEESNYGKELGYIGYEGAMKYFYDRVEIEEEILRSLQVDTKIINTTNKYDEVFEEIKKILS